MLIITTEVYSDAKEDKISSTMSEMQQAFEHDFKQNWPGQVDQSMSRTELDGFRAPPSRDTQQV